MSENFSKYHVLYIMFGPAIIFHFQYVCNVFLLYGMRKIYAPFVSKIALNEVPFDAFKFCEVELLV